MEWTPIEIKQLRYRLGYSQAEMARHLRLDLAVVVEWEAGRKLPGGEHCRELLRIFHQAESDAARVQRRPIAEVMMRDRGLSQIHDFEVLNHLATVRKN